MKMLSPESLPDCTALDELVHQPIVLWCVEGSPEPLQRFLHPFVPCAVGLVQHCHPMDRRRWKEDAALKQDHIIGDGPAFIRIPRQDVSAFGHNL
jgi:hypothetical protein